MEKEQKNKENILAQIRKNPKSSVFIDLFDKAGIIGEIANSLKIGEKIIFKIDEESDDYPNILKDSPPRLIIQNDVEEEKIPLADYLEKLDTKGYEISLKKEKNDYFLSIKKTKEEKLDLKLKIDRDRTIDLKFLSADKSKKDKVFFGVKSYYYVRKME